MPAGTIRLATRGLRAADGGLAQMRAPEGTLISYATQPGNVALDGTDGHSPYTRALASTIKQAGVDIFQTFNQVGLAVKRQTGGSQQPWVSSSPIDGNFYFVPPAPSTQVAVAAPPEERLASTLRPDPDRVPIKDPILLRELSDRLFELNYDPEPPDSKNGMRQAITKFQEKARMTPTGECHRRRADAAAQDGRPEAMGLDRLRPRQRQMGNVLESCIEAGGDRRRTQELRREQMSARIEFLRIAMRRVCDLGQILVAGPARHRCARQGRRA